MWRGLSDESAVTDHMAYGQLPCEGVKVRQLSHPNPLCNGCLTPVSDQSALLGV